MGDTSSYATSPAHSLRRIAAVVLALVAAPLTIVGVNAITGPDNYDLGSMSSSHFDGVLAVLFAAIAVLAAVASLRGRVAFRNLGCAGTWLLASFFGFDALLIGNLVPNARVSVDTMSAVVAWALALGTTGAGVLLVAANILGSGAADKERG